MSDYRTRNEIIGAYKSGRMNEAALANYLKPMARNMNALAPAEKQKLEELDNTSWNKLPREAFPVYAQLLAKAVGAGPGIVQATKKPTPKRKVTAIAATRVRPEATKKATPSRPLATKKPVPKRLLSAERVAQIKAEKAGHPLDKVAANIRQDPWAAYSEKKKVVHPFVAAAERMKAKCFKVSPLDAIAAAIRNRK